MSNHKVLHIIVPCYNPDQGWEKVFAEKYCDLKNHLGPVYMQLTLVNDGSAQGVSPECKSYVMDRIPDMNWMDYMPNKGKGHALREGMKAASGDWFIYTDIDFPYTAQSMADIFTALQNGADIAVGQRENEYYDQLPRRRILITRFVKQLIKYMLTTPVTDTQCGLKGFNDKGRAIFLKTRINRFLFDMEFIKLASAQKNIVIREVVVRLRPGISFSHMNYKVLLGEAFNFIMLVMPLRRRGMQ